MLVCCRIQSKERTHAHKALTVVIRTHLLTLVRCSPLPIIGVVVVVVHRTTLVTDHGIIEILLDTECLHSHCRITCLILNNLSISFDNKQAMVRSDRLLNALLTTIHPLPEETYLVCICLMNLSFWQESHSRLLHYCPTPPNIPLENPKSLLRIIESIMLTYVPLLSQTTKLSVEGEAVRWTTGLLRNLVSEQQTHHHAKLIAETKLPRCLLSCLRDSHKPLSQWKRDTLEDLALQIVLNLAKWPESSKQLQHLKAQSYLEHIEGQGGIHDVRVSWIRCSLESLSS